jgi:hypothetical protein
MTLGRNGFPGRRCNELSLILPPFTQWIDLVSKPILGKKKSLLARGAGVSIATD